MKKQILSMAAATGLVLGGLGFAGAASALGGGDNAPVADVSAVSVAQDDIGTPEILTLQDTESETESPSDELDGERRGCGGLDEAAATIGLTEDELHAALDSGQSIADVAQANGVAPEAVIDAMVDAKSDRIAEKVESGRITQAEADAKLADKAERIAERVYGTADIADIAA